MCLYSRQVFPISHCTALNETNLTFSCTNHNGGETVTKNGWYGRNAKCVSPCEINYFNSFYFLS